MRADKISKKLIFFEKTPFMSVELLSILPSLNIACYNEDKIYLIIKEKLFAISSYGNKNFEKNIESDKAVEIMLSSGLFLRRVEAVNQSALFFFMNDKIDKICRKNKIKICLPPFRVQKWSGDKLSIRKINNLLGIKENPTLIFDKSRKNNSGIYQRCIQGLKSPFVMQGRNGVSGSDTFFVRNEKEFRHFLDKTGDKFRASRYISNLIPLSVHLCIKDTAILYEGPFLQIIGFNELTNNPFQFSGNDTNQSFFNRAMKITIKTLSIKIGEYLKLLGYRGIAGVDFLWDLGDNNIYLQEINARLVGLTRLLTGIQNEQKIKPHLLDHIECFLPNIAHSVKENNRCVNLSTQYSQLYISNNSTSIIRIKHEFTPGIYKIYANSLVRTKNSLFVSDLDKDTILVTFCAPQGTPLKPGEVMVKIIMKKSVIQQNVYKLTTEFQKIIKIIRNSL